MSKIMNQVPGWKTSKLERSSSRGDPNEEQTSREERTMSASAATEAVLLKKRLQLLQKHWQKTSLNTLLIRNLKSLQKSHRSKQNDLKPGVANVGG